MLTRDYGGAEDLLLAELQFAFVTFLVWIDQYYMFPNVSRFFLSYTYYVEENYEIFTIFLILQMGQSLEGFLQWKNLVSLLLGCTEAVSTEIFSCFQFDLVLFATILSWFKLWTRSNENTCIIAFRVLLLESGHHLRIYYLKHYCLNCL